MRLQDSASRISSLTSYCEPRPSAILSSASRISDRADPAWRAEAAALVGEEMREIAGDLEQVPLLAEDHEGAGGRHVLERDMAAEFSGVRQTPEGPLTCTAATSRGAAVLQHLLHASRRRVFVDPRTRAIAGHREIFVPAEMPRAVAGEHAPALQRDLGRTRTASPHC